MIRSDEFVLTFGETMALISSNAVGLLRHSESMHLSVGGAESNVAIGLQRLGIPARWVGRVGSDSLGDLVVSRLLAEGIDVRATVDHLRSTGLMIKERRTPDSQQVSYFRRGSAGSELSIQDLPDTVLDGVRLVHVSGITPALSSNASGAVFHLLGMAIDRGITISLDVNYRSQLWTKSEAVPVLRAIAKVSDIVFGGRDEAEMLVGAGEPQELAERIIELGPSQAVIKLGAQGAMGQEQSRLCVQAGLPITPVDTVGAGDAFVAGYLSEALRGEPLEKRLLRGTQAGAFACLVRGDWEGNPRTADFDLLNRTEPVTR